MTTNEELFREWQSGKADALTTLVQRYHAPLVAHFYRLLGDAHLAEDLAQDTFFRLVRNARSYRYPQPFLPWLYRIARNLALNYQESAYHRYVDLVAELPETLMDDADPQAWVERQERQAGGVSQMIFPIPFVIRYISQFMTLEPGDLIATGTPAGVGPLQPGDSLNDTRVEVRGSSAAGALVGAAVVPRASVITTAAKRLHDCIRGC